MTTPIPWSPSGLEDFCNCPRSYHEKRVLKNYKDEKTPELIWGRYVHDAFDRRQASKTLLPPELAEHEPYMQRIEKIPGRFQTENKIALDKIGNPCTFFSDNVWYRGVIDYKKLLEDGYRAFLADYKTGKPHEKWKQLVTYALHTFILHKQITLIDAQFYWTKTQTTTRKVFSRDEIPTLWELIIPDLKQYKEAFDTDTWQPRPSGLCHGWCPVQTCEFWKPRRPR